MAVGCRSYTTLASFLSLNFKFVNDFMKIRENASVQNASVLNGSVQNASVLNVSVQNAPFQVSHNTRHQICPSLSKSCTDVRMSFCFSYGKFSPYYSNSITIESDGSIEEFV